MSGTAGIEKPFDVRHPHETQPPSTSGDFFALYGRPFLGMGAMEPLLATSEDVSRYRAFIQVVIPD